MSIVRGCVQSLLFYYYLFSWLFSSTNYSPCKFNETNICEIYLCALCLEEERPKSTRMCIGWMCAIIRCSIALGVLHLIKQLALGSYDLSQAELKVTVVKPDSQNENNFHSKNGQKL